MSSENRAIRLQPLERLVPPLKMTVLLMLPGWLLPDPAAATIVPWAVATERRVSVT